MACGPSDIRGNARRRSWSGRRDIFSIRLQFSEVHTELWLYFEQTTERLIREAIHADTADAETAVEPASLR